MISIESYLDSIRRILRRWALDPRVHTYLRIAGFFLAGFLFSAASLANYAMPLGMSILFAFSGWGAVTTALGSALGYLVFWGSNGYQGLLWVAGGLLAKTIFDRRYQGLLLLYSAISALIVSASGVIFQSQMNDVTPVGIYLTRVFLGTATTALWIQVAQGRNPILEWLICALGSLALAQVMPIPYLGLGFLVGGILAAGGAFPAAALSGVALDLAQVTPVSMTAVLCAGYLVRLVPNCHRVVRYIAPTCAYFLIMALNGQWDFYPVAGLLLGTVIGCNLPAGRTLPHRRGEIGGAQVKLELVAQVLSQTEQLLLEAPEPKVDEIALVTRAAERACGGCPCRKTCKDSARLVQVASPVLHKPLLSPEELPLACRKSNRFLAELHRSQEHLRSIRADRQRQMEYRSAVVQQHRFLAEYLQDLSDMLGRRGRPVNPRFSPEVLFFGNRPEEENGDRCSMFAGPMCRYYVLLCDGMGTGTGAVQEGNSASELLRRLLVAGYPAEHALRSLNSLCALRERAGAVTVDLLEIQLDTGKATLYKWGAPASFLVTRLGAEKIGIAGPPPGLSVTDYRETADKLSLRRGETLILVSDGIGEEEALHCCLRLAGQPPGELAEALLSCGKDAGEDDATVITVRLDPVFPDLS